MKFEVFILGGREFIRRERRDGGEARGNEERERERGLRGMIKRKRQNVVDDNLEE